MKILIIGDIYGNSGKQFIINELPKIKKHNDYDLVIANAENVSIGGKSLTKSDYESLSKSGIDYFTMGNHTFRNSEFEEYVDSKTNIVRPGNAWLDKPGTGKIVINYNGKKILLLNALGQIFIPNIKISSPLEFIEKELDNNDYDFAIVDFHAETTAEKIILGNYFADRVSIFYGTHTHVQTSDERILKNNCAYITDVGFVGVLNSAIGADFKAVTDRMRFGRSSKFVEAVGKVRFNSIVVEIDDFSNKAISIKRLVIEND